MRLNIVMFLLWAGIVAAAGQTASPQSSTPPNILFCLADDWGWPHAGAYGDTCVKTPHFDRLADEGVLFQNAYVSSPSCTPSRNAFITGKYHWQLDSGANLWSTLPVEHQSFIHLLRDNGYVTGRTREKTWGPGNAESWIEHHGAHPGTEAYQTFAEFLDKTEAKDKPFFFWQGTSDPHRGYKKDAGKNSGIDPNKVHLFKHYPDSDVIRSDVADYYFEVQRWDTLVGSAIAELEKHGLLENTVIIMTGDHGMPFPRCKAHLYDCGVRVPFAVRWGRQIKAGRQVEDFISFADIAATLLEISETPVPADMTGTSFANLLTSEKSGRLEPEKRPDIVFGRERHTPAQAKPNMGGYPMRGLRNPEFLYIRNFQPDLWPAGTGRLGYTNRPNQWYADCDGGPSKNYIFLNRDKDDEHRRAFELCFGKRPADELYDLIKDPDQIHNLAADPAYADTLKSMQARLVQRLAELGDPRAHNPNYDGFDKHPYFGGFGSKYPNELAVLNKASFKKTDHSVTLMQNDAIIWQFNYGKEQTKPYFHPLSLADGTVLTWLAPPDHPWHYGLWFSWKYINGVNYWEENRQTGKAAGITEWDNVDVNTNPDGSANITMDVFYHEPEKPAILTETRAIDISAPDDSGAYTIDWTSRFTAVADTVELSRTPLHWENKGKPWGGYAGLSFRACKDVTDPQFTGTFGPVTLIKDRFRYKDVAVEYSGVIHDKPFGMAILDHPDNLNSPTPWYLNNDKPMNLFSPAVLCYKAHEMTKGDTFALKYRILIHPERWDCGTLMKKYQEFERRE